MAKTNWQDPKTSEMRSTHVAGLMEAVGKIEDSIGMESVYETNVPLTEVFISSDDRYRIFQAPEGKRNWTAEQPPVIKRNGSVISSGFEIDYGGGAIVLNVNDTVENTYTADVTYIKTSKVRKLVRFVIGTSTSGWTAADCDYLCDGTADQTEINAAITALPATGGEIVILDGTYNITGGITINKDNVSIKGSVGTILKRTANNNRIITLLEVKNCKVEGLIIDGNLLSNLWNEGIRIENSHSNTITGVVVKDNKDGAGIRLMNSTNNIIFGNNCSNIGLSGSSITGGIQLNDSDNNAIIGNICSDNQRAGVYMVNSNNNTITGNICHNNEREGGIYLSSSNNNTVTGNTCIRGIGTPEDYTTDQYTIRLYGTKNNYNLISSNNCMGKAVVIGGGTGNSAWGNKFDNTDDLP